MPIGFQAFNLRHFNCCCTNPPFAIPASPFNCCTILPLPVNGLSKYKKGFPTKGYFLIGKGVDKTKRRSYDLLTLKPT